MFRSPIFSISRIKISLKKADLSEMFSAGTLARLFLFLTNFEIVIFAAPVSLLVKFDIIRDDPRRTELQP